MTIQITWGYPPLNILTAMNTQTYTHLRLPQSEAEPWVGPQMRPGGLAGAARKATEPPMYCKFEAWLPATRYAHDTFRLTHVLTGQGCYGEYL